VQRSGKPPTWLYAEAIERDQRRLDQIDQELTTLVAP
jgi:hypothetical protein